MVAGKSDLPGFPFRKNSAKCRMTATRLGTSLTVGGLLRVAEEVFSNPDS
jgi:hypothetical protein